MPKRPCPFDDDLPPQLKIHVGQKQVDNGVCREERMKSVYGRTMDLLKEGVKSLSRKLNTSLEMNDVIIPPKSLPPCKTKQERNLKQMVLNGRLELSGTNRSVQDAQPKFDLCECSRVIDQSMFSKCSYCDQILCSVCLFECSSCSDLFCQNCSLPVYDYEERNKCLNCYK